MQGIVEAIIKLRTVYEQSDENTEIVHCNIEYKQKRKEETAKLIILKGM